MDKSLKKWAHTSIIWMMLYYVIIMLVGGAAAMWLTVGAVLGLILTYYIIEPT